MPFLSTFNCHRGWRPQHIACLVKPQNSSGLIEHPTPGTDFCSLTVFKGQLTYPYHLEQLELTRFESSALCGCPVNYWIHVGAGWRYLCNAWLINCICRRTIAVCYAKASRSRESPPGAGWKLISFGLISGSPRSLPLASLTAKVLPC